MAKLTIELDTETDSLSIELDGKPVANVQEARVSWCDYDTDGDGKGPEPCFELFQYEDLEGYRRYTRTMAVRAAEAARVAGEPSRLMPGYVAVVSELGRGGQALATLLRRGR